MLLLLLLLIILLVLFQAIRVPALIKPPLLLSLPGVASDRAAVTSVAKWTTQSADAHSACPSRKARMCFASERMSCRHKAHIESQNVLWMARVCWLPSVGYRCTLALYLCTLQNLNQANEPPKQPNCLIGVPYAISDPANNHFSSYVTTGCQSASGEGGNDPVAQSRGLLGCVEIFPGDNSQQLR